ncbi:ADP-ribosylation factor-like protein 6-interacting protein 4 [Halyomorpha halys]|uniref:ADP-ribosylation factor-like protein 6-interacting protein 4 n=1 Tax=Halyomorpha halys TaxID=286706 RepID=UPI0006D5239B|nr:ADP-ribosylation factor-like protein 6-interacting protein 4 [Halyomorpha halys]
MKKDSSIAHEGESSKKRKRSSSSDSNPEELLKKKHHKKLKKKKEHSPSGSNSDSDHSKKKAKEKKKHKKNKKDKKEKKKKKKSDNIGPEIPEELIEKRKKMAPMTKEEWEKKQSIIKRVYDSETGRHRLIKGSGEVLEEIVSKDMHKKINKQATIGDGNFFQTKLSNKF